jgi:hypothetical protein
VFALRQAGESDVLRDTAAVLERAAELFESAADQQPVTKENHMSDLQQQVQHVIHAFVTQVTELARAAAMQALVAARVQDPIVRAVGDGLDVLAIEIVTQVTELARAAAMQALGGTAPAPASARVRSGRPAGTHSPKRTAAELEATAKKFVAFVAANPGLRIEQINKQLGTTTAELMLPIRNMVVAGTVVTQGEKRSTTYHPSIRTAAGKPPPRPLKVAKRSRKR